MRHEQLLVNELTVHRLIPGKKRDTGNYGSTSDTIFDMETAFLGKVIETGTYASAVDNGVTLSDNNTRPVSFLFDDGGNSIGGDIRAVLSRVYLSADQDGGGTIYPIRGQLKLADGVDLGTGGRYGSVDAYLELAGDHQVKSGVEATILDVRVEIGSGKTLTVASGGELIGVHVQTVGAGTLTSTGNSYGIKVEDNGSITGDWKYGVYLSDITNGVYVGACTTGISLAGAMTTGLDIGGATTEAINITGNATRAINIDTGTIGTGITIGGTLTTGISVGACTTGFTVTGTYTTGISLAADGTTGISITSAFSGTTGISFEGTATDGIAISGACATPINISGAFTTGITLDADGTTAISVTSNFSGTNAISLGGTASNAGINISGDHATGIVVADQTTAGISISGATVTGLSISGACSTMALQITSAAGTGIQIGTTGSPMATDATGISYLKIWSQPTIDDGEYHVPIWVDAGLGLTGGGSIYGIRGNVNIESGITMDAQGYLIGVHGRIANAGTANNGNIIMAGILGQVLDGGTYTSVSHIAAGWFDWQGDQTISSGSSEILYLTNNGATQVDSFLYLYGNDKVSNLFTIYTADDIISSNNAGDATFADWRRLAIDIEGTTHYLIAAQTIS